MLFSCLVDADYLVLKKHFEQAEAEEKWVFCNASLVCILSRSDSILEKVGDRNTSVNQIRARSLSSPVSMRRHAKPWNFSNLAVPLEAVTLSGLAFALRHAVNS